MTARFSRYELRTVDLAAGRAFYEELLGAEPWGDALDVVPLPEPARARGAPAHWLGHVAVDDVEATARLFIAAGAEPLGPTRRAGDGSTRAALRDPFGAVMALTSAAARAESPVARHLLCTRDQEAAFARYASIFGWAAKDHHDLGDRGRVQDFAWAEGGETVGSITDLARQPQIHTQWLFYFTVADLDAAIATVRAGGGLVLPSHRFPDGGEGAACDDPQGAAFGLYRAPRAR